MHHLNHIIDGAPVHAPRPASGGLKVRNPASGELICDFASAGPAEVEAAVASAMKAMKTWSHATWRARSHIIFNFRELCLNKYRDELVTLIMLENGKHRTDATAELLKGLEVTEFAVSPTLASGSIQEVSSGITCQDRRDPLGLIVSVCPFNFPAMVPLWTIPTLLVSGNVVIVKPSEKVPFTMTRLCEIFIEAGLPKGVLSVLHGGAELVSALVAHEHVAGVTFVGSTPVAKKIYELAMSHHKRAICLGGAKNHLVLMPDADFEQSATDILNSFAGSAGQRCMAASVLVLCEHGSEGVLPHLIEKARAVRAGQVEPIHMGPLIDQAALDRVNKYIDHSVTHCGGKLLVDGRSWMTSDSPPGGYWVGPTIIEHPAGSADPALHEEIFGPVLSVVHAPNLEVAIDRINKSPFGNAACIYTRSGPRADSFCRMVNVGMMGVNVGVPVPREPFSFGGTKASKFGIGDITGEGLIDFCTIKRKITTKWGLANDGDFVSRNFTG